MVLGLFLALKWAFYPLIDPLQVSKPCYVRLHAGRAVLLHALGYMAVYVQSKGRRSVAEIPLNGFHIVAVLKGKNSKGVPKIMHPASWGPNLGGQLFVMIVYRLWAEIASCRRGEYQGAFLLLYGLPARPQFPGSKPLCSLLPLAALQQPHNEWGGLDGTGLVVLQGSEGKTAVSKRALLELLADLHSPGFEVYAVPSEPDCL